MPQRVLLATLIALATIGFVVGTTVERSNSRHESAAQLRAEGAAPAASAEAPAAKSTEASSAEAGGAEAGGESSSEHAAAGTPASGAAVSTPAPAESAAKLAAERAGGASAEAHPELRPLGVNVEAVPFVVLAVLASLGLAALAWARPRWARLLAVLSASMVAFAVLDLREVFHQHDEARTGLALLAAAIAALHLAAATAAGRMAAGARRLAG